jgi:hypothetical protein
VDQVEHASKRELEPAFMDLVNATGMTAAYTLGLDPDGRERLVVVVKGTFLIPSRGGPATLADASEPLVLADTFTGKPGFSAVLHESDFAPFKPRCDVLLVGSAHAPRGRPVTKVSVMLTVGSMKKSFEVVGDRYWTASPTGIVPSGAKPFASLPITYDRAFGGPGEVSPDNPALSFAYPPNPVGVGYFERARDEDVFGKPLPNTHETGDPVSTPRGKYRPMSLGPVGRNFQSRYPLAGTYDKPWLDDVFPFLPADFNVLYYQAAPVDQQIAYPVGGETVHLVGLTPDDLPPFRLPHVAVPVEFTSGSLEPVVKDAPIDTIVIEPDSGKMHLVWRASLALKKSIREVQQVVVGTMPTGWYRARERRKRYYPSLGALAAARARES